MEQFYCWRKIEKYLNFQKILLLEKFSNIVKICHKWRNGMNYYSIHLCNQLENRNWYYCTELQSAMKNNCLIWCIVKRTVGVIYKRHSTAYKWCFNAIRWLYCKHALQYWNMKITMKNANKIYIRIKNYWTFEF